MIDLSAIQIRRAEEQMASVAFNEVRPSQTPEERKAAKREWMRQHRAAEVDPLTVWWRALIASVPKLASDELASLTVEVGRLSDAVHAEVRRRNPESSEERRVAA